MSDCGRAGTSSAAKRRRGETLESRLAPRAAQRQDGPGCSPAPPLSARGPTGTDDSQGSWEAAGAGGGGHGRLRGCRQGSFSRCEDARGCDGRRRRCRRA